MLEDRRLLSAGAPELLAQQTFDTLPSFPKYLVTTRTDIALVEADDGLHGRELWRTDGTAAGTYLLRDLSPGAAGSAINLLGTVNGAALLRVQANGLEQVLRSDGTPVGTYWIPSLGQGRTATAGLSATALGSQALLFLQNPGSAGYVDLYSTDGTEAGTQLLSAALSAVSGETAVLAGTLYFRSGDRLWQTDGTSVGTQPVSVPAGLNVSVDQGPRLYENAIWYTQKFGGTSGTLIRTDGTVAGTEVEGSGSDYWDFELNSVARLSSGNLVYRTPHETSATTSATQGTLYLVNGDGTATVLRSDVSEYLVGPDGKAYFQATLSSVTVPGYTKPRPFPQVGVIFFLGYTAFDRELFTSDGTLAGTGLLKNLDPTTRTVTAGYPTVTTYVLPNSADPRNLQWIDGALWFTYTRRVGSVDYPINVGRSTGNAAGTDLVPGGSQVELTEVTQLGSDYYFLSGGLRRLTTSSDSVSLVSSEPGVALSGADIVAAGNRVYFYSTVSQGVGGTVLYTAINASDGTPAGTSRIYQSSVLTTTSFTATRIGSRALFANYIGGNTSTNRAYELFSAGDVDAAAVGLEINRRPTIIGSSSSLTPPALPPTAVTLPNGRALFPVRNASGTELWAHDPASDTTYPLETEGSRVSFSSFARVVGGEVFVRGTDATKLFRTDGTSANTWRVDNPANPLPAVAEWQYYRSTSSSVTVMKSNGTPSGTSVLRNTGTYPTYLESDLVYSAGKTFFKASTSGNGQYGLWVTDGTSAGTLKLYNYASSSSMRTESIWAVAGGVLFTYNDVLLRFSDGTLAGTQNISPSLALYRADLAPVALGGSVYFLATNTSGSVSETNASIALYQTSGTSATATQVVQNTATPLAAGTAGFSGRMGYYLYDGVARTHHIGVSDGTAAGTYRLPALGFVPWNLTMFQDRLYFTNGKELADELWVTDGTAAGTRLVKDLIPSRTEAVANSAVSLGPALVAAGDYLYVRGSGPDNARGLWRSDGTGEGTFEFYNPLAPVQGFNPSRFLVDGDGVYFSANINGSGAGFYRLDTSEQAPLAQSGGPYAVGEFDSLTLDASASSDPLGQPLTYRWDLNGDGVFGDVTGMAPLVDAATRASLGIAAPGAYQVQVRVSSGDRSAVSSSGQLTVLATPHAALAGPNSAVPGEPLVFVASVAAPWSANPSALFTYEIDWDNDNVYESSQAGPWNGLTLNHVFTTVSTQVPRVRAIDPGGVSGAVASRTVAVERFQVRNDPNQQGVRNLYYGGDDGAVDEVFLAPDLQSPEDATAIIIYTGDVENVVRLGGINGRVVFYGQGGDDIVVSDLFPFGIDNALQIPVEFHGDAGDDILVGGSAADTLDGGPGGDLLWGGAQSDDLGDWLVGADGDDLLIGHRGADTLEGGAGSDLLWAGVLDIPALGGPDAVGLTWIEWSTGEPYADRVAHLLSGLGGFNEPFLLAANQSVFDDTDADRLVGGADEDFFLANPDWDTIVDLQPGETLTPVIAPPRVEVIGASDLLRGTTGTFTLVVQDVAPAVASGPFTFAIDWDGDGLVDDTQVGAAPVVSHLFVDSGTYPVRVSATDGLGQTGATFELIVTVSDYRLVPNLADPTLVDLEWGGTPGNDYFIAVSGDPGMIFIFWGDETVQRDAELAVTGEVRAYGYDGDDALLGELAFFTEDPADYLLLPIRIDGGAGADSLIGGAQDDQILGGAGDDLILGRDGNDLLDGGSDRDVLVGGLGADTLSGGADDDLLIAGNFQLTSSSIYELMEMRDEWLSVQTYLDRVANVRGPGNPDRLNNDKYLVPGENVLDDGAVDHLYGDAGQDWFFWNLVQDQLHDQDSFEEADLI